MYIGEGRGATYTRTTLFSIYLTPRYVRKETVNRAKGCNLNRFESVVKCVWNITEINRAYSVFTIRLGYTYSRKPLISLSEEIHVFKGN